MGEVRPYFEMGQLEKYYDDSVEAFRAGNEWAPLIRSTLRWTSLLAMCGKRDKAVTILEYTVQMNRTRPTALEEVAVARFNAVMIEANKKKLPGKSPAIEKAH